MLLFCCVAVHIQIRTAELDAFNAKPKPIRHRIGGEIFFFMVVGRRWSVATQHRLIGIQSKPTNNSCSSIESNAYRFLSTL